MRKIDVVIGEKYGYLTIISDAGSKVISNGKKVRIMEVRCDCGCIKTVMLNELRQGKTVSCGCYNSKKAGMHFLKHGYSGTRLHGIWKDMKRRCYNPKRKNYKNYGGRGIVVCDEWNNDFLSFQNWALNNGYDETLTIDRINVNGNYEPSNCRWVSRKVQNSNTRKQRDFIAISPSGEQFNARVIGYFAKDHGLDHRQVGACLKGRQKTHLGWKFYYY